MPSRGPIRAKEAASEGAWSASEWPGRACLQCSVLSSEAFSSRPAIGGHGDCNVAVASQQANLLPSCVGSTRPAAAAVSMLPRAASIAAAAAATAASRRVLTLDLMQPRPAALMGWACPKRRLGHGNCHQIHPSSYWNPDGARCPGATSKSSALYLLSFAGFEHVRWVPPLLASFSLRRHACWRTDSVRYIVRYSRRVCRSKSLKKALLTGPHECHHWTLQGRTHTQ